MPSDEFFIKSFNSMETTMLTSLWNFSRPAHSTVAFFTPTIIRTIYPDYR